MLIYTPPSTAKSIPVIDLSDSFSDNLEKRKSVAWEIHKACRTTGFFYIKNHGIASEVLQKQLGVLGILPPYIAKPSEAPVCRGL